MSHTFDQIRFLGLESFAANIYIYIHIYIYIYIYISVNVDPRRSCELQAGNLDMLGHIQEKPGEPVRALNLTLSHNSWLDLREP